MLAAIAGAHGLHGEVRLKLFTDDLSTYSTLNGGALTLVSVRPATNGVIGRFREIADRTKAEAMRGTELWIARDQLPPLSDGEYYHADLLGLPVVSTTGEGLGQVVAIDDFGAGDVIEIERPGGKRFMVPMQPHAVPEWNAERLVVEALFAVD
ncbi:ribosome maturation factor RimM [Sphingomonas sp. Leaf23]|uniref:ribosome maturation factor RimM n=1 Tax=Sphingomonas sp. Leaf23 TaxID=1735689 RepID=UPI0006F338CD|nr:ribosome maturation factor RimM [Sphingomonas sp. Leaf23]KQM86502.1 ribosome maturation factor RimM [Sphingomonas sp. Leaf23]